MKAFKFFAAITLTGGVASADPAPSWASYVDANAVAVIAPRTLPSGRPACGNIPRKQATKKPSSMSYSAVACDSDPDLSRDLAAFDQQQRSVVVKPAPLAPVLVPRMLANGRPACGNIPRHQPTKSASTDDGMVLDDEDCESAPVLAQPASASSYRQARVARVQRHRVEQARR